MSEVDIIVEPKTDLERALAKVKEMHDKMCQAYNEAGRFNNARWNAINEYDEARKQTLVDGKYPKYTDGDAWIDSLRGHPS